MIVSMSTIAKINTAKEKPPSSPLRQLTRAVLFGPGCRNRTHIRRVEADCIIRYTNPRNVYLTARALAVITGSMSPLTMTLVHESANPEA